MGKSCGKCESNLVLSSKNALIRLASLSEDPLCKNEAGSLVKYEFEKFEFLLAMVIWYTLLNNVNRVSKKLYVEDMHVDGTMDHLKGLICFFKLLQENGFESSMVEAEKSANELGIEPLFSKRRVIRRKKQFDENNSEETMQSPKNLLESIIFCTL